MGKEIEEVERDIESAAKFVEMANKGKYREAYEILSQNNEVLTHIPLGDILNSYFGIRKDLGEDIAWAFKGLVINYVVDQFKFEDYLLEL